MTDFHFSERDDQVFPELFKRDKTQCLITGCALYLQHMGAYAWGDLHMQGDRFIFNGAMETTGEMAWRVDPQHSGPKKGLMLMVGEEYFERRGVLICRASRSLLNAMALAYLGNFNLEIPE